MIKFNETTRKISGDTGYLKYIRTNEIFKAKSMFLSIIINPDEIIEATEKEYLAYIEEMDKKYGD